MEMPKPKMPLPRDVDEIPQSDILPFRSKKINVLKSPALYFAVFLAVLGVLMFGLPEEARDALDHGRIAQSESDIYLFARYAILAIVLLIMFGIYVYSQSDKPIWFLAVPAVYVPLVMSGFPPLKIGSVFDYFYHALDFLQIGKAGLEDPEWRVRFWNAVTGPGFREEFFKALPIGFGAYLVLHPGACSFLPPWLRRLLAVRSPLDGLLIGCALGGAFTFVETGFEYIEVYGYLKPLAIKLAEMMGIQIHGDQDIRRALQPYFQARSGQLREIPPALLLAIQGAQSGVTSLGVARALNDIAGHAAYSGIFGYFIGLSVLYGRSTGKVLLIGFLLAAALHGLWDSGAPEALMPWLAALNAGLLILFLVKARQIDGERFGRGGVSHGSIVVGLDAPALRPQRSGPMAPPPDAPTTPTADPAFTLSAGAGRAVLRNGVPPDFNAIFGDRGPQVRAEVVCHPSDPGVLGLLNAGEHAWYARFANGSVQSVEPGKKLKLSDGASIDFGSGLVAQVQAQVQAQAGA